MLSFDNFVTSFFTSGVGTSPMPIRIYGMIKFGISPVVNAVGTFMMVFTVSVVVIVGFGIARFGNRARKSGRPQEGRPDDSARPEAYT